MMAVFCALKMDAVWFGLKQLIIKDIEVFFL